MLILKEIKGVSDSARVRFALEQCDTALAQKQRINELRIEGLRRQVKQRDALLLRVMQQCRLKPMLKEDLLDLGLLE